MKVTIRRAKAGDDATLAKLNAFVHKFHVDHNPSHFRRAKRAEVAQWFRGLLEKPTARIWIAEKEGAPVGYAVAVLYERAANPFCLARRLIEIDQIGVRRECRGSGIGRRLVERVLRFARAERVGSVELTSWCFNGEAHKAFEKLGFIPKFVRFGQTLPLEDSKDVETRTYKPMHATANASCARTPNVRREDNEVLPGSCLPCVCRVRTQPSPDSCRRRQPQESSHTRTPWLPDGRDHPGCRVVV